jgi:hypothetical protein
MNRLTELGIKYNTDKAYHHKFTDVYEPFFQTFKNPNILEIGIYNGGSFQMMNEYFDNQCKVVGLDNGSQLGFTSTGFSNLTICIGDQGNEEDLSEILLNIPKFDIIIDDGSHMVHHQQISFSFLFEHLNSDGVYIIEDLHTSFCEPHYNPKNIITTYKFLEKLKNKENPNSPCFSDEKFNSYISKIEDIHLFRTICKREDRQFDREDSITSVIKKL